MWWFSSQMRKKTVHVWEKIQKQRRRTQSSFLQNEEESWPKLWLSDAKLNKTMLFCQIRTRVLCIKDLIRRTCAHIYMVSFHWYDTLCMMCHMQITPFYATTMNLNILSNFLIQRSKSTVFGVACCHADTQLWHVACTGYSWYVNTTISRYSL